MSDERKFMWANVFSVRSDISQKNIIIEPYSENALDINHISTRYKLNSGKENLAISML